MRTFKIEIIGWLAAVIGLCLAPAVTLAQPDGMEENVSIRAVAQRSTVKPGGRVVVALEVSHRDGWHTWPVLGTVMPKAVDRVLNTEITLSGKPVPTWVKIEGIQWPKTHEDKVPNPDGGAPILAPVYSGVAIAYVRLEIAADAKPGEVKIPINYFYQACNDRICALDTDVALEVPITISATADEGKENDAELFKGFDATKWGAGGGASVSAPKPEGRAGSSGTTTTFAGGPVGLITMFLSAVLGGFILNLMPCVLPVIPIKILSLSKSAGNPRRCFYLGAMASAGIIAAWMAAGLIAALLGVATNQLYTFWWFNLAIGLLIAAMALGMLGLFVVNLPQSVYMVNPTTDSAGGSFVFGMFTVVLALPCVAPFAGAVSSWALAQPAPVVLLAFFGIGLGMALPYLILSAKPAWINKIPRTGPASELVKYVMGGLMLAIAVYFLGCGLIALLGPQSHLLKNLHWIILTVIAAVTAGVLLRNGIRITRSMGKRAMVALLALVLVGAPGFMTYRLLTAIEWPPYSRAELEAARARGDVVIAEFTAVWCLNCQTLWTTVLSTSTVEKATTQPGVTRMMVNIDLPEGRAFLREVRENGIPLLVVYKPGDDIPTPFFKSNGYTIEKVTEVVSEALTARTAWLAEHNKSERVSAATPTPKAPPAPATPAASTAPPR